MQVQIDLKHIKSKQDLLRKLGAELELGGPNGNVPASMDGKGWGMNWDALKDSLTCLDTGGIWGTSKRSDFPLKLVLINYESFAQNSPKDFRILMEILETVIGFYSRQGKVFEYEFA
jgi:hypothetical protein